MRILVAFLFVGLFSIPGYAEELVCVDRTLVRIHPGAKWSKFADYRDEHVNFIVGEMKGRSILTAGPTLEAGGGYSLYTSSNFEEVEQIVKRDVIIREGVATYSMQVWKVCQLQ